MLSNNSDRETLAATIAQAVVTALASLEQTAKQSQPARESLTINALEFSQESNVGLNRVRELLRAGKIKHVRSGRRILIPRAEVQAYLERESVGGEK